MEKKQHHYTSICVILSFMALSSVGRAAQPLNEGSLALQTGVLNNALPRIIVKAKEDALKPEEERWRAQRALSDWNLREIRINTILESVLSPHQEQKKSKVDEPNEKKVARMKPHTQDPDRFVIYEFDSNDNVHGTITIRRTN